MAFSDEEEDDGAPRKRRRTRGKGTPAETPWPRKEEPLSWAMLPPEEEAEEEEEEEGSEEEKKPPRKPGAASASSSAAAKEAPPPAEEEDWKKRYQYLLAEFENYRRRVQKETESAVGTAKGAILLRVIGLHEGIERALAGLPADAKALREGLSLVLKNMDGLLHDEGVEPVAAEGAPFQLELHEAVGKAPATEKAPEGSIAVVVQQGYRGPTGLLRPAKVLVAAKA